MWFDAKSAKEQLAWATGGSAISVIIGETPYSDNKNLLVFKITNNSDVPAYNVKIRMINANDLQKTVPSLVRQAMGPNLPEGAEGQGAIDCGFGQTLSGGDIQYWNAQPAPDR